jgi:hypothetical protein
MYFPYFRGKEFEVKTIGEMATFIKTSGLIIPILEPVRRNSADVRNLFRITQIGVPLIVVENPAKGELANDHEYARSLVDRLSAAGVRPGFLIGSTTTAKDVAEFLKRNSKRSVALVHVGSAAQPDKIGALQEKAGNVEFNIFFGGKSGGTYRAAFRTGKRVIIEDGFERQARNEDYRATDFFSDRFRTYRADGFDGFGDFLIVGNYFTKSGGGALAVAIHLTNIENGGIMVRHFVSDRTTLRNVDTPGKFFEALQKAVVFIKSRQNSLVTEGCKEFLRMADSDFQGLGFVKKVSMKHHVELMASVIGSGK